jgi:hypothetical protein
MHSAITLFKGTEATEYDVAATREEAALYVFNTMTTIDLVTYSKDEGYVFKNGIRQNYAATKYNYAKVSGIITETQKGKNKYTVLTPATGAPLTLNIDASSNLVGHKVSVIYDSLEEKDSDNVRYYNAYYIEDLSKEVSINFMRSFKTIYTELGGSKAAYDDANFTYWLNNVDDTINNATFTTTCSISYIAGKAAEMPLAYPNMITDPSGSFILDDFGKIIGFKKTSYTFEKVRAISTTAGSESITLSSTGELKNSAAEDVVVEYDGIAKGDYVSVTRESNIYTLVKANVVKDVKVTNIDTRGTINGTYAKSPVFLSSESSTVGVGGIYDLYLDKTGSYALAVKVASGIKNVAFVSYLSWSKSTGAGASYSCYATCVLADGTVKDFLITPNEYAALGGPSEIITGTTDYEPNPDYGYTKIDKLYEYSLLTDVTYYNKQVVADFDNTNIATNYQKLESNYRVLAAGRTGNYILTSDVEYIFVNTDVSHPTNPKTLVNISKTKPSSTSGPYTIYFYPILVGGNNYEVNKVFIVGVDQSVSVTSLIYSSFSDTKYPSNIGHRELNADNLVDYYLHAFIDKDYVTSIKLPLSEFNAHKTTVSGPFGSSDYLNAGFYSYTISPEGYYDITPYTGVTLDSSGNDIDKNAVVLNERLSSIYAGMISTIKDDNSAGVTDLRAGDAAIVDFTGWNITSLDQLYDLFNEKKADGSAKYTIRVSCWSYLYDTYKGTDKATTNTLYINAITPNP